MLFVPLLVISAIATLATYGAVRRWPAVDPASPSLARRAAQSAGDSETVRHGLLGRLLVARRDPTLSTGFLLTVAAAIVMMGGVVLGALALLVRSNSWV